VRNIAIENLIYTDLAQSEQVLVSIAATLKGKNQFQERLDYHRYSAFLENQKFQYNQALINLETALEIASSLSDKKIQAETLIDLAAVFINLRQFDKAEIQLETALKLIKNADESPRLFAYLRIREAAIFLHFKQYKLAFNNLFDAERIFLSLSETATLKDYYYQTLLFSSLGRAYEEMDDLEMSVSAYMQVLDICEVHEIKPRLSWHYLNGGRARMALNDFEDASDYFIKSLQYTDEKDLDLRANSLANLGILAFMSNNEENAFSLLDEAVQLFQNPEKPSDFNNLSKIYGWKAKIFLENKQLEEAEVHFENAIAYAEKGESNQQLLDICVVFADLMAEIGNFQKAYTFQKRAAELTKRHNETTHDRDLKELQNHHELIKRRQESNMAKLRLTGLQLKALRAQMNPHFLFNALNALQGLITSGKNTDAETYLARFAKFMRRTLEYSDTEKVSLESEIEFLEYYLDVYKTLRFNGNLKYSIKTDDDIDWEEIFIPSMIIQPFIENAIEHGLSPNDGGKITVNFVLSEDEESLLCIIEDDGVGLNKSKAKRIAENGQYHAHRSRGMEITKERLTLLQEQKEHSTDKLIKIMDLEEKTHGKKKGTRVEVIIPII
jgi:two-component system, LytTR family, sensor kinase